MSAKQTASLFRKFTRKRNILSVAVVAFVMTIVGAAVFTLQAHAADPTNLVGTYPSSDPLYYTTPYIRVNQVTGFTFPVLEVRDTFYHCSFVGCSPYSWRVQEYDSGTWNTVYDTDALGQGWHANGVLDVACYISKIKYGYAYRVVFSDELQDGLSGNWWLIGHEHDNECTSYL